MEENHDFNFVQPHVVVVEFDDFVGRPVTPRVGAGADNDLSTLLARSGCSRASMPRCMGKELADRAVARLCVYWCSIERASVRKFMCTPKFRCFIAV